jgi:hypothetical protein
LQLGKSYPALQTGQRVTATTENAHLILKQRFAIERRSCALAQGTEDQVDITAMQSTGQFGKRAFAGLYWPG